MKNKNHPNKKKLLNSKWTAAEPKNKEKHFTVTEVKLNDNDPQIIDFIVLTAIFTGKTYQINHRQLENESSWKQGWV